MIGRLLLIAGIATFALFGFASPASATVDQAAPPVVAPGPICRDVTGKPIPCPPPPPPCGAPGAAPCPPPPPPPDPCQQTSTVPDPDCDPDCPQTPGAAPVDCDPDCPQTSTVPSPDCDPDCPQTPGAAPADCDPDCPQTSTAPSPDCDPDCPATPGAAATDCDTPGDDCADPMVVVERSVSIAQVACEPTGGDDPGEPEEEVLGTVIERAAPAPAQVPRQALPRTGLPTLQLVAAGALLLAAGATLTHRVRHTAS